jgi:hypothetical protein
LWVCESDGYAEFAVVLSGFSAEEVTVDYLTADGTALAGSDFTPRSGVLTFAPGESFKLVCIDVTDDAINEEDESFYLDLIQATGAALGQSRGEATILINDQPPVLDPIGDQWVDEESVLMFTATASSPNVPLRTLTFSLDPGAPPEASINPYTGEFYWMTAESDGPGTYEVTIRVTEDGAPGQSAHETITITVGEVNAWPTTSGIADVCVDEDAENTTLDLHAAFEDADHPDTELIYQLVSISAPELFTSVEVDGNRLVLDYAPDANGWAEITILAADPEGATVEVTFSVTINPMNDAPVLTCFQVVHEYDDVWSIYGTVQDDDGAYGLAVTFGGILASYSGVVLVDCDGTFSLTDCFPELQTGIAEARAYDSFGESSNVATYYVLTG